MRVYKFNLNFRLFRKVLISDSSSWLSIERVCNPGILFRPAFKTFAHESAVIYRNNLTTNQPQSVPKSRLHLMSVFVIGFAAATSSARRICVPWAQTQSIPREQPLIFSPSGQATTFKSRDTWYYSACLCIPAAARIYPLLCLRNVVLLSYVLFATAAALCNMKTAKYIE